MLFNCDKIILDLCGGTGAWSKPYKDAGYDVRIIDGDIDVRWFRKTIEPIYGVLAAPPCTHLSRAGAQYWAAKDSDGRTLDHISIMDACIRVAWVSSPVFWCLENPIGRMLEFLGPPKLKFDPCDYGDPWTKRTWLWGDFNIPQKGPVEPEIVNITELKRSSKTRSITPPGFAKAFFKANQ